MNQDQNLLILLMNEFSRAEWTRALSMVVGRPSGAAMAVAFAGVASGEPSVGFVLGDRPDHAFIARTLASLALLSSSAKARVLRRMESVPASRQVVLAYAFYFRLFSTKSWRHWVDLSRKLALCRKYDLRLAGDEHAARSLATARRHTIPPHHARPAQVRRTKPSAVTDTDASIPARCMAA